MPSSKKKVVFFKTLETVLFHITVGARADVLAYGHPLFSDGQWVHTSTVLKLFKDGSFETHNTIYKPKKD